jgi:alkanesulfonate monooxygenase SsuD/methylene tetrahydromethanopterin reductase-like flavin-dependent oxidoreductase (luciferase family)
MLDEGLEALRLLFRERRATHDGRYYAFDGIELYPKPVQSPLPVYVGGNDPAVLRRAALYGQGWIAAAVPPAVIAKGRAELFRIAEEAGRDMSGFDVAPQIMCCMGRTHEAAVARFRKSRMYVHLITLAASTMKSQDLDALEENNLIGTPDEVVERLQRLEDVGVTSIAAMSFLSESVEIMADDMQRFAEDIMPKLHGSAGTAQGAGTR